MKACNACHVHVQTGSGYCPLCGEVLHEADSPALTPPQNHYPNLSATMAKYSFLYRLLLFITLLGCGVSVLVNWLVTPGFWWCLIVIAASIYCWLTIPPLLRRGVNFAKQVVVQVLLTSALAVALDGIIGYSGWSTSYVVPSLLGAGTLAIGVMIAINRTNWVQYVLYQFLMGLFGFVPLVLYLTGLAQNLIIVLITTGLSLASLLVTIVFADRGIKSEFRRRFHL